MPTEAKRATVAELVEAFSNSQSADRVRLSRPHRVGDIGRSAASCATRASPIASSRTGWRRSPPRRPAAASWRRCSTGPSAIALGGGDESALARALLDAMRPFRTVAGPRRRPQRQARSTATAVTRLATLPVARRAAGPAGRRHRLAAERAWRRSSRHRCATSATPCSRSPTSARPRPARDAQPTSTHHPPHGGTNDMATLTQDQVSRGDRRHDRPRAVRVHQEVRRALRRHGRGAGCRSSRSGSRRRSSRSAGRGADRVHGHPGRDRPQQDPGHQGRARADRPRASRRPRTSWTRPPRRSRKASPRTRRTRSRPLSRSRAPRSRSSRARPHRSRAGTARPRASSGSQVARLRTGFFLLTV